MVTRGRVMRTRVISWLGVDILCTWQGEGLIWFMFCEAGYLARKCLQENILHISTNYRTAKSSVPLPLWFWWIRNTIARTCLKRLPIDYDRLTWQLNTAEPQLQDLNNVSLVFCLWIILAELRQVLAKSWCIATVWWLISYWITSLVCHLLWILMNTHCISRVFMHFAKEYCVVENFN